MCLYVQIKHLTGEIRLFLGLDLEPHIWLINNRINDEVVDLEV